MCGLQSAKEPYITSGSATKLRKRSNDTFGDQSKMNSSFSFNVAVEGVENSLFSLPTLGITKGF